jgi:hypothetical protein
LIETVEKLRWWFSDLIASKQLKVYITSREKRIVNVNKIDFGAFTMVLTHWLLVLKRFENLITIEGCFSTGEFL